MPEGSRLVYLGRMGSDHPSLKLMKPEEVEALSLKMGRNRGDHCSLLRISRQVAEEVLGIDAARISQRLDLIDVRRFLYLDYRISLY